MLIIAVAAIVIIGYGLYRIEDELHWLHCVIEGRDPETGEMNREDDEEWTYLP